MIELCSTCLNREYQLTSTLPYIALTLQARLNVSYNLVLFGEKDHSDTVSFIKSLNAPRMTIYSHPRNLWFESICKNIAHLSSSADYVVNLDCDQVITAQDIDSIDTTTFWHRWSQNGVTAMQDGTFGCMGMPSADFKTLGGYNEQLLPMGHADKDLLTRWHTVHQKPYVTTLPTINLMAIQNTKEQGIQNINASFKGMNWLEMNFANAASAIEQLNRLGPCRTSKANLSVLKLLYSS